MNGSLSLSPFKSRQGQEIDSLVASLLGAWHRRISSRAGLPGVSVL